MNHNRNSHNRDRPEIWQKHPLIHTSPPEILLLPFLTFNRNNYAWEILLSQKDINHEILCRFILFSLLIMSATKMRYTVYKNFSIFFFLFFFFLLLLFLFGWTTVKLKCNVPVNTIDRSLKYQYAVQWVFKSAVFLCKYKVWTKTASFLMTPSIVKS